MYLHKFNKNKKNSCAQTQNRFLAKNQTKQYIERKREKENEMLIYDKIKNGTEWRNQEKEEKVPTLNFIYEKGMTDEINNLKLK